MTIVSGEDHRNSDWANNTSAFGHKMLLKMGWKKGNGLGKNQQGTNTNLRAVRRQESLGIGATTDTQGDEGFSVTSKNFHGVLAQLQAAHGDSSSSSKSSKDKKKKKKSEKKNSKKELNRKDSGLTLSSKRVTAGHARKMREAKDLNSKSKEDMAAIFGMKVDQYQQNSVWGRMSTISDNSGAENEEKKEEDAAASTQEKEDKKRKKDKKKRKKERDSDEEKPKKKKKKSRKEE